MALHSGLPCLTLGGSCSPTGLRQANWLAPYDLFPCCSLQGNTRLVKRILLSPLSSDTSVHTNSVAVQPQLPSHPKPPTAAGLELRPSNRRRRLQPPAALGLSLGLLCDRSPKRGAQSPSLAAEWGSEPHCVRQTHTHPSNGHVLALVSLAACKHECASLSPLFLLFFGVYTRNYMQACPRSPFFGVYTGTMCKPVPALDSLGFMPAPELCASLSPLHSLGFYTPELCTACPCLSLHSLGFIPEMELLDV